MTISQNPDVVKSDLERTADYRAFVETLDPKSRIPTFAEWQMSIETPIIVETPKWPIEPVREVVRKRPVTSLLGALLFGLLSGGVLGPKSGAVAVGLLDLLKLFGL